MKLRRENIGKIGEEIARQYYIKSGFSIVTQNFFNRMGKQRGEIDFIALRDSTLVFVEVKTRRNNLKAYESAVEAMTQSKRIKLVRIIEWYLAQNLIYTNGYQLRIDVCVVLLDKTAKYVRIISNAVEDLY